MNSDDLLREPDPADLLASARLDGEPAEPGRRDRSLRGGRPPGGAGLGPRPPRRAGRAPRPGGDRRSDRPGHRRPGRRRGRRRPRRLAEPSPEPTPGPAAADAVVPLASERRRSAGRRWLAAAAAVVVVAALAGAIVASNRPHSSSFDTVAAPVDQGVSTTTVAGAASPRAASGGAASTTTAAGVAPDATAVPDLGAVASEDSARDRGAGRDHLDGLGRPDHHHRSHRGTGHDHLPGDRDPFRTAPVPAPSCDSAVRASVPGLGVLVFAATASYQGESVQVLVYGTATPTGPPAGRRAVERLLDPGEPAALIAAGLGHVPGQALA